MSSKVDKAVKWALSIANDSSHGYSQQRRWGPDYDCSSFVITAFEQAGIKVKSSGATFTGNMKQAFLKCGFVDVTSLVNLRTGSGLIKGDVLLNIVHHTAMVSSADLSGSGIGPLLVHASRESSKRGVSGDQDGKEICVRSYYNYPWNVVLRYAETDITTSLYGEYSFAGEDESEEGSVIWNNRTSEILQKNIVQAQNIACESDFGVYVQGKDITGVIGDVEWNNSVQELACEMTFKTAKTDMPYLKDKIHLPQVGNVLQMYADGEKFRGVIIELDDSDKFYNSYIAADMGYFTNKTSQTYQFKKITISEAIRKICADLGIPIAYICRIDKVISKIFFDETISEIITELLKNAEGQYNFDFVPEGIRVYKIGEFTANPRLKIADNIKEVDALEYLGGYEHSISIDGMINSVKVTSEEDNVYTELLVMKNQKSIDDYGFLQKTISIDPEKEDAQTVAKEEMAANGKLVEKTAFDIIENISGYTRAGEILPYKGQKYVITSSTHSIKKGRHYCRVEAEVYSE